MMANIRENSEASSSMDSSPTSTGNFVHPDELWELELDLLGASASAEQLQAHLDKCPDPASPTAQFLVGYLAHAHCSEN